MPGLHTVTATMAAPPRYAASRVSPEPWLRPEVLVELDEGEDPARELDVVARELRNRRDGIHHVSSYAAMRNS
jgi:hypothetical protein